LCLFQPHLIRKSVGEKTKSPALYVDGYVPPTVDSWQDFFLGTDEDLADMVVSLMNPRSRLLLAEPTSGAISLAPAEVQPQLEAQPAHPTVAVPALDSQPAIDVQSSTVAPTQGDGTNGGRTSPIDTDDIDKIPF
jgi:hypothetical protein